MAIHYETQRQGEMSASDVKNMQQALKDWGYNIGSSGVDGIWGKDTAAALRKFKADTGGTNTYGNTVGNETLQKLYGTGPSGTSGSSASSGSTSSGGTSTSTSSGGATGIGGALSSVLSAAANIGKQAAADPYFAGSTLQYNNLNTAYNNQMQTLQNGYDQYVTELESGKNNANAALDEARQNALAGIKSTYDDSARNYYRLYRTQEKELPEQLSSIGATGGATESAALRLMNNYSDNLYKNETARNQDMNALNEDYYNAVAQNSSQLASQIADAYLQLANQQADLQNQKYTAQQNLISNYINQYAANQEEASARQLAIANANTNEEIANLKNKGYNVDKWTDADGYIRYVYSPKSGTGSGGGGGGGDDATPDASESVYQSVLRNALANMYGNSTYGMKTDGAEDAAKYVQGKTDNKTISQSQAKTILQRLGLA